MKLHSDKLTTSEIRACLERAIAKGRVARLVDFSELAERGSRTRANAWEIRLEWLGTKEKGDGRKWTNSGNRGSGGGYAAFWEEWGWFIWELYAVDSELVFGHYKTENEFHEMTRFQFAVAE